MSRGRPKKPRKIQKEPSVRQFSPRGRIGRPGHIDIPVDGYEAMRLTDFIGLDQKEAAASMGISRQTYGRILKKARKALIEGIVLGRIIKIASPRHRSVGARNDMRKGQKEPKKPA